MKNMVKGGGHSDLVIIVTYTVVIMSAVMISLATAKDVKSVGKYISSATPLVRTSTTVSPQSVEPESFFMCLSVAPAVALCAPILWPSLQIKQILPRENPCCHILVYAGDSCLPKIRIPWTNIIVADELKKLCQIEETVLDDPEKPAEYSINKVDVIGKSSASSVVAVPAALLGDQLGGGGDHGVVVSSKPDLQLFDQCLSSVGSIEGCVEAVVTSFLTLQVQSIGPACCKAILEINDGCWPNIFPFNPFFPPLLKDYCLKQLVHVAPSPPTQLFASTTN